MECKLAHTDINVYDLYENKRVGIYFIADLNGYWLEIVPDRR